MAITVPVLMDLLGSTARKISTIVPPIPATTGESAETVSTPSPATALEDSQEADASTTSTFA